jgi:hypothetical protein
LLDLAETRTFAMNGTTVLWRVTLQHRQGKSPLAIESIDDCYCRLPRGVTQ